ncbi:Uncharacterized conserved protein YbjT, contains NAD(P)-binding and DUF2867 domains [Cnuella takakiae]|uniref:Uncharacterized conserved protein YbjT, contains NAD(P)-binding and DUF2867 domains n=1 Tax=Cnuella takakiae TaxID=1302690 RepID=A0A1M5I2W1_9BACT|nr:NmrA family NAD(P)-binding protein [Cnuella takakiae]OLY91356.1 NmrA family protein [Cnuella takakiae]SHG22628.1 Uncharacterized conserved protein YbjT, contains NAD(P)-binding and DUF2867 domains [Cnuella takakiae]
MQEQHATQHTKTIILAGATGDLGHRIATYLLQHKANVKALIRKGSNGSSLASLQKSGLQIVEVDYNNAAELAAACAGGACVVSALNGLEDVIIGAQSQLLQAAIDAGVPRFIPSDYSIDYTKLTEGSNRNLDLRRRFHQHIDSQPIKATSILNGMFTDLLTGQAPIVLSGIKRVLHWGSADQLLDFTTIDNTAEYTTLAALDDTAPRYLCIAGDVQNAHGLQAVASKVFDKPFKLLRPGGLGALQTMIRITRKLFPQQKEIFPPWQGMQYMHNMFTGLPKLTPLNNDRYPSIKWTSVQEVLAAAQANRN